MACEIYITFFFFLISRWRCDKPGFLPSLNVRMLFYTLHSQVFNCFGRQFCLHFEAFQLGMAPVYMAFLRFMGDDNEAKKFSYSLEVGGNGRKLIWQGIPRGIRDSHRKVRDSQDGLIIQRNLALYFSGGERQELKLRITGRIWKEEWMRSSEGRWSTVLRWMCYCTVKNKFVRPQQGFGSSDEEAFGQASNPISKCNLPNESTSSLLLYVLYIYR